VAGPNDADTLALLSAFLDGELGAAEERDLLRRLEQEPALQDALDALASQLASTHRIMSGVEADGDLLGGVLAGLPADAVDGPEGAAVLASLAADGEGDDARLARLDALCDTEADTVTDTLAFVDATRAVAAAPGETVATRLQRLPDLIGARVEATERGFALSAAAADGALDDADERELLGLVAGDADLLDTLQQAVAARVDVAGADRGIGEALAAFSASPQVARLAERAGAAALQAIAAEQENARRAARPAAGVQATQTTVTTTTTLWARVRQVFSQGFVPLAAAGAAAAAFFVIGTGEPQVATPAGGSHLAEVQRALMAALEPAILATGLQATDGAELPVIDDNTADVEAIDATGTTMVFETAASNITVIWVAGLDDEEPGEQGT
jgi:hypothetical protein